MSNGKTIKVCFLALGAYPLLTGKCPTNIIGPDIHQVMLIKKLKNSKFDISVITHVEDGTFHSQIDNIEIIKMRAHRCRLRPINIILVVLQMWSAMKTAKAQVYFNAGGNAGIMSIFCRLFGKKYVYAIASDALVNRNIIPHDVSGFSRSWFSLSTLGNWLDIKLANTVIAQSEYQKMMLNKNFHKDGIIIKMPFPINEIETLEKANPNIVLWVGSMAKVKQPELFVKLADAIPKARFQMIGGHSDSETVIYDTIKEADRRISNFEYLGVVPFEEINKYFCCASVLVNTSMFEGFPNAFVQSWIHHVPVVSLNADPDGLICKNRMGFHSKTFDQMVKDVALLIKDKQLREEMGVNAREYVEKNHNIADIAGQYIDVFNRIMLD